MFHFFFECPPVKLFWDSLATWLGGKEGVRVFPEDLAEEEFLLGIIEWDGDYSLFNYIILFAKFFIYKTNIFLQGTPELFPFLIELKNRLSIERLTCFSEGSYTKRFKKWDLFYHDLWNLMLEHWKVLRYNAREYSGGYRSNCFSSIISIP